MRKEFDKIIALMHSEKNFERYRRIELSCNKTPEEQALWENIDKMRHNIERYEETESNDEKLLCELEVIRLNREIKKQLKEQGWMN